MLASVIKKIHVISLFGVNKIYSNLIVFYLMLSNLLRCIVMIIAGDLHLRKKKKTWVYSVIDPSETY